MICRRNLLLSFSLLWWLSFLLEGIQAGTNFQARIINGQQVNWNSTRYQVSVRLTEIDRYFFGIGHLCGGSIIARYAILTSAHCIWNANNNSFYPASKFTIVLGNLDRSLRDENTREFGVSKIIMGTNFNATTFRDDLAIMFLNQSIPENFTRAEVINLSDKSNTKNGETCIVTGWGLTEKQINARNLMMIEVPIINRQTCSMNYGPETILNGMLCAGYMSGERDACSGDSGGPLVCDNQLVGIVSFGLGCAMPGYPGVYTNVTYYYDWIQNQTGLTNKHGQLDSSHSVITSLSNIFHLGSSTMQIECCNSLILSLVFCLLLNFYIFLV